MDNSRRNSPPPPQNATINSPAFQEWQKGRQSEPAASVCLASEIPCGGSGFGSGSGSGFGSGGGGYGLALISDYEASRERIEAIMRDICERERQK